MQNNLPSNPQILLVDDSTESLKEMRFYLDRLGFEATVVSDGHSAIQMATNQEFDLIILDMMMPRLSGFLVLDMLRKNFKIKTPVIMVSDSETDRHEYYARMLGASDYLKKPFQWEQFREAVEHHLSQTKFAVAQ